MDYTSSMDSNNGYSWGVTVVKKKGQSDGDELNGLRETVENTHLMNSVSSLESPVITGSIFVPPAVNPAHSRCCVARRKRLKMLKPPAS